MAALAPCSTILDLVTSLNDTGWDVKVSKNQCKVVASYTDDYGFLFKCQFDYRRSLGSAVRALFHVYTIHGEREVYLEAFMPADAFDPKMKSLAVRHVVERIDDAYMEYQPSKSIPKEMLP